MRRTLLASTAIMVALALAAPSPSLAQEAGARSDKAQPGESASERQAENQAADLMLRLPDGFRIEKVVDGLNFPTSLAWDDQGRMYVAEAGGALYPEQKEAIRILRVEPGNATEVVNLTDKGVMTALVGLTWHDGAFYFTHRDGEDLTGAVSRATIDGEVEQVFKGIIDSQAEHQINDIAVGPDGRMYVSVGAAGNSGVVDPSIAPWVMKSPELHTTTCRDVVLTGRNFKTPNFMTKDDKDDMAVTGAFVPFGTETEPGQRIEGTNKCGGAILAFDPANAEETIEPYAWGFRNLLGLAWNPESGDMYAAQNGYDIRGARPVQDEGDPVYRVREGAWYGVPDFSAALKPLTDEAFEVPDEHQALVVVNGEEQGKNLEFVIDHEASGLTPPDPSLLLSMHPFNSSPSMIDVAPSSWGDLAGHVFVAEWGDLAPPTNPLRGKEPAGYRVVQVDPGSGEVTPFVWNTQPGPASMHDAQGQGLDRPFEVEFGPDGALYIVDYGVVKIDKSLMEQGEPPYREVPGTGVIWKVTRSEQAAGTQESKSDQAASAQQNAQASSPHSQDHQKSQGSASTMEAVVHADNQPAESNAVTVSHVVMPSDGFVVIHAVTDGQVMAPQSIGHTMVKAGESTDVSVELEYAPPAGESYVAMLHEDTGEKGAYEFGPDNTEVDKPVVKDGKPVTVKFTIE